MTCIVGIEVGPQVYLAGDSAATNGWESRVTAVPKIFRRGDFLMGYTSSFRMGQLLQYGFTPPENDLDDPMAYMVSRFVPGLRDCLKDGGYAVVNNNRESAGFFLVGYRGYLFQVQDDFSVLRRVDGFDAVGAGESYALAVLLREIRYTRESNPLHVLRKSLEISAYFSNGVSAPFHYINEIMSEPELLGGGES